MSTVEEDAQPEQLEAPTQPEEPTQEGATGEPEAEGDSAKSEEEQTTEATAKESQTPAWVKELRRKNREIIRENKRLQAQLEAQKKPQREEPLPQKPTLEAYNYDESAYETAVTQWIDKKQRIAERERAEAEEARKKASSFEAKASDYAAKKQVVARTLVDYDEKEDIVKTHLSETQQAMLVHASEDATRLVYELGADEDQLEALSKIDDAVLFVAKIAKIEAGLTRKMKTPPPPEKKVEASSATGAPKGASYEKLMAEAEKTGDYTKVAAYNRKNKR